MSLANRVRPTAVLIGLSVVAVLAGCGAAPVVPGGGSSTSSPSSTPSVTPSVTPSGPSPSASATVGPGVSLRELGFVNGPDQLRLPTGLQLTTSADQVQQVTLVISSPQPSDVITYLRASLPATGFTIARQSDDAMEFSGHGWRGSYVATGAICAVTLQPVA